MKPTGGTDLLVAARGTLLDALEALHEHRRSVIVIGAQAIYMHTGGAPVGLAESTKDSDLALDTRSLGDVPLLEDAMTDAGFRRDLHSPQPGSWLSPTGIPVDLMVPEALTGNSGRRGARIPPHSKHAARRAAGLEAAVVDHAPMLVTSLDSTDHRTHTANVAGPGALLIAKMHKLGERQANPGRLIDKDAHDLFRLLVTTTTEDMPAFCGCSARTTSLQRPRSKDSRTSTTCSREDQKPPDRSWRAAQRKGLAIRSPSRCRRQSWPRIFSRRFNARRNDGVPARTAKRRSRGSHLNEFHVPVGGLGQHPEIREVGRRDVAMWSVSSASKTSAASMTSEVPVRASSTPELLAQCAGVDAVHRPHQQRLPGSATPPDLADHAAVGNRQLSRPPCGLKSPSHRAVVAPQCDDRAGGPGDLVRDAGDGVGQSMPWSRGMPAQRPRIRYSSAMRAADAPRARA
ncbi:MAG: hypothetical protein ACRDTX_20430 [Pseudonocardiaceae bacterium]